MNMALVEAIAGELRALAVRQVVLSGGEAMQHPQWHTIAQRLRAEGTRVTLLTNGLLLRKQIDAVLASVDEVIVSLDGGTAATYEAIRGVDGFDLILDGIRLVRAGGLPVTTRTTVQRANYREIPQIIAAAKAADVTSISFLTVDVSNPFAFGNRFQSDVPLIANMGAGAPIEHGPPASALTADDIPELARVLDEVEAALRRRFRQRADRRIARQAAPHGQLLRRGHRAGRISYRALQRAASLRCRRSRWIAASMLLPADDGQAERRRAARRDQYPRSARPAPRLPAGSARRMPFLRLSIT